MMFSMMFSMLLPTLRAMLRPAMFPVPRTMRPAARPFTTSLSIPNAPRRFARPRSR